MRFFRNNAQIYEFLLICIAYLHGISALQSLKKKVLLIH